MANKIYDLRVYLGPEDDEGPPYETEYRGEAWDCDIPEKTIVPKDLKERNFRISAGDPRFDPKDWVPWQLTIPGDAKKWDFYTCEMSTGVFSPKAIEVLQPYFLEEYPQLPVTVNGEPFIMLHVNTQLDCLDVLNSDATHRLPPNEHLIRSIEHYAFHKGLIDDPIVFSIPQKRLRLFASESIPLIVEEAGLRGFRFDLLDG